jgi:hypothetical protein
MANYPPPENNYANSFFKKSREELTWKIFAESENVELIGGGH